MVILRYSRGLRPSILRFEAKAVSMNFFSFTVNLHVFANLPSIVFYAFSNSTIKLNPKEKRKNTIGSLSSTRTNSLQAKTNEAKA
jgi:hypothetical protein